MQVEVQPITGLAKQLTYAVPLALQQKVFVGSLVRIPLGRRSCLGIVTRLGTDQQLDPEKIKPIESALYDQPVLTLELIKLGQWMQVYYASSVEAVYETLIPAVLRQSAQPKIRRYLAVKKELSAGDMEVLNRRAPKQAVLYNYLLDKKDTQPWWALKKELDLSEGTYKPLLEKGIIEEIFKQEDREAYSDQLSHAEAVVSQAPELMPEQAEAFDDILKSLEMNAFQVHLLHGVTGSGKTEVYLGAMRHVLKEGGSALFMVPEIVLTPQTVSRVRGRLHDLGIRSVVWHSNLSNGERLDAWLAMARGEARVVVGARSAIFTPLQNLKLIIVDEEHEPSFKQAESPRYHGRDVAIYRSMLNKAVCVLGSATPSLESLHNVEVKGYKLNCLTKRVDDRQLPVMHIVDMKRELIESKGKGCIISRPLREKLEERLDKKEQSILFLNRRGFSSRMLCPKCGHVEECPHCSLALTYHRRAEELRCHLCGFCKSAPDRCPPCDAEEIRWKGYGTQRVEDVVQSLFPNASIARMDTDTLVKKNQFREVLSDFRKGKYDILLGTQMIAKGLDFPNVTLVGVIDADISMHVQDFRAGERTFQLLVQVAGRAGRGDRAGEVVVQTFSPHIDPIQFSRRQDFNGFLQGELGQRKEFNYPPYRHLIRHVFRSRNNDKVAFFAEQWARHLEAHTVGKQIEIRGPSPAPLEKIKDFYRYQLWYFTGNVSKVLPQITALRNDYVIDKEVIDIFDVDPVDMN